jgi:hypothetical protein
VQHRGDDLLDPNRHLLAFSLLLGGCPRANTLQETLGISTAGTRR